MRIMKEVNVMQEQRNKREIQRSYVNRNQSRTVEIPRTNNYGVVR